MCIYVEWTCREGDVFAVCQARDDSPIAKPTHTFEMASSCSHFIEGTEAWRRRGSKSGLGALESRISYSLCPEDLGSTDDLLSD